MTSVVDLWRALDPEARLLSGSPDRLRAAVRGLSRTRVLPPHLPEPADGHLVLVDATLVPDSLDDLVAVLHDAELRPVAVLLSACTPADLTRDRAGDPLPVLASVHPHASLADAAVRYLDEPERELQRIVGEVRLAAAEAALADPSPGTPAGLLAARLRRGVAVSADGVLLALHPRPAGRALAARFAAIHARFLAASPGRTSSRQTREGLHLLERRIRAGASVWLFDDLPFARIDEVLADAVTISLRALLARPPQERPSIDRHAATVRSAAPMPPGAGDTLHETLVAVARANGRVATAARALGVHRNTVLYRIGRAVRELGIDPRRPEDALRLLREAEAGGRQPGRRVNGG